RVTVLDAAIGGIPVPGEIVDTKDIHADNGSDVKPVRMPDGTFGFEQVSGNDPIPPFSGVVTVASDTAVPRDAVRVTELPNKMLSYAETDTIPADVVALAKEVTKGAKTDYEKAQMIQHEIEKRCGYNL